VGVWFAAPLIATRWIKADVLQPTTIEHALRIMSLAIAFQWPVSFYQGGLLGLQRQVQLNAINVVVSTFRNGGAALVLWKVSPSLSAYFVWQIVTSCLQVALLRTAVWRNLPLSDHRPRLVPKLVKNVLGFASGVSGISIASLILTQMDKVILSRLLSLQVFGYYMLASMAANGLGALTAPVFNALFPRFSSLAARGDQEGLKRAYHLGAQLMAVLVLPTAMTLVLFAHDILLLWIGDPVAALQATPIVRLLVLGSALNGIMHLPYALQLSHGWTRLGLMISGLFIVTMVPGIILMAGRFGAVGAAAVWAFQNATYVLIGVPLTHRRLLLGEGRRWFLEDTLLPLGMALLVGIAGRRLFAVSTSPLQTLAGILSTGAASIGAAALAARELRAWVTGRLAGRRVIGPHDGRGVE